VDDVVGVRGYGDRPSGDLATEGVDGLAVDLPDLLAAQHLHDAATVVGDVVGQRDRDGVVPGLVDEAEAVGLVDGGGEKLGEPIAPVVGHEGDHVAVGCEDCHAEVLGNGLGDDEDGVFGFRDDGHRFVAGFDELVDVLDGDDSSRAHSRFLPVGPWGCCPGRVSGAVPRLTPLYLPKSEATSATKIPRHHHGDGENSPGAPLSHPGTPRRAAAWGTGGCAASPPPLPAAAWPSAHPASSAPRPASPRPYRGPMRRPHTSGPPPLPPPPAGRFATPPTVPPPGGGVRS